MVRGVFSKLNFPYAQFATRGATADELYPIILNADKNIEGCGLKVIVITTDGVSPNRKFMQCAKPAPVFYTRQLMCLAMTNETFFNV